MIYNQDCMEAMKEMSDNQFEAAKKRIEQHKQQTRLF